MYAVVRTGGKQYRVTENQVVAVEKIAGEPGTMVALEDVILIGESGKAATVDGAKLGKAAVFAEVLEQGRADKVIIFKKKRRHNYRRKNGHRQFQTVLRVIGISETGSKPAFTPSVKKKAEAKPAAEKKAAPKKAAPKKAAPKKAAAKKAPAKKKAAAKTKTKTKTKKS